ncbi:glycosyltransferase [Clostridium sediminicola]|uniref:MGDG synthase family glycosyltransferase n=1 Tax=Clostridium sediminicola TaxID=3114879 RepID=UPI0031F22CD1
MKKALILTASTGAGHNQAAKTLENLYNDKEYETYIFDFLKNSSSLLNFIVADGYEILAKNIPKVYGDIYRISDKEFINDKLLKKVFVPVKRKVLKKIMDIRPEIIIATHPLAVSIVSRLKEKGFINIPFISIVTDYKAHYAYVDKNVDAYVTGSLYTKNSLIKRNISKEKIFSYGIPIREDFFTNIYEENKNEEFSILIMGGSMGLKDIAPVLKDIIKSNHNNLNITVICGKNEKLKNSLLEDYSPKIDGKKINIIGFTKDVPKYMEKNNLIISKPGGLTVSESIAKNIPMVIPFAIPGQEEENTEFLVQSGAAIKVNNNEEINKIINYLVENEEDYNRLKANMYKLSRCFALENIINLSDKLIYKYNNEFLDIERNDKRKLFRIIS